MKTNDLIEEKKKEFEKELGHHGEIWNGKKFARDGIEAKDFLSQSLLQIAEAAREETIEELINIFKDRDLLEQYTTNVIMLELKTRLDKLKQPEKVKLDKKNVIQP